MFVEVEELLDSLTPSDVGWDTFADILIRFEGFTDECWAEVLEKGKTLKKVEDEIISDWANRERTTGLALQESGWWTPDIFYAIYRK